MTLSHPSFSVFRVPYASTVSDIRKNKRRVTSTLVLVQGGVIFMAAVGHCISQAKHCMQSFSRAGSDFFSEVGCPGASAQSNRDTGQTSMHMPSPVQTSQSTATLVPCIPSFFGGSTGPQTLWPLCSPAPCRLLWKSGSIGKNCSPFLVS